MFAREKVMRCATAVAAMVLTACGGDPAGPADPADFDAPRTLADIQVIDATRDRSAWLSFTTMAPRFGLGPAASAAVTSGGEILAAPNYAREVAVATARRLIDATNANAAAPAGRVLPEAALGKTFVYDAVLERYVAAPGRSGAPGNGVRYILYAVNPITRVPIVATEIGHADLTDEGAPGSAGIALRLVVVSGGTTFLDYSVEIEGTESSGSLSVAGFVFDGKTRLRFRVEAHAATGSAESGFAVAFHFAVPERGLTVAGSVQAVDRGDTQGQAVQLTVHSGAAAIGYEILSDGRAIDARVTVNGRLFATVRGDPRNPEIRRTDGRPLSPEETRALHAMLQLAGSMLDTFWNLLRPVEAVLGLSQLPAE